MTPERYQRIKELFHSALERTAEERPAFLAEACGNDTALRAKVEALVAADEQPGSFMDAPAYAVAAEMLTENSNGPLVGQSIGHYQVLALLGSGGRSRSNCSPIILPTMRVASGASSRRRGPLRRSTTRTC